jgi:tetratricopeptide (TPR) repeat protein
MIFINYRKADTQAVVGHLAAELKKHFGDAAVFIDHEGLHAGDEWPKELRDALDRCQVLLAVVGEHWLTILDDDGNRRIDNEDDWVRREICTVLEAGKRVIVLLVGGAKMPSKRGLPRNCALQQLPDRQSLPLRPGPDFAADVARLIADLSAARPDGRAAKAPPPCPAHCFGRDDELRRLVDILAPADPAARVPATPLAGIGGIGKSTLILTAMHDERVVARYGERRHFVRLDGATSRPAVVACLAEEVGLALGERLEARLLELLRQGPPRLIVLDNAETPLSADGRLDTEELFEQLAGLPPLALVATLRPNRLPGRGWRAPVELRRIDEAAARETFLAATGGRFHDDPGLAALLRELDGWPLALTVLAHQAQSYADVRELTDAWRRRRTGLLTKGVKQRDADIGACIELSLTSPLMTEPGRRLLTLLGLLPDGIRRDALAELLPPDGVDAAAVLRRVGGLTFDDGPRLRVLAPVREYLAASYPPRPEDRERAVGFYCVVAYKEGHRAGYAGGAEAIARVAAETGNLTGMVRLGLEAPDPEPAFRGAFGLGKFTWLSGIDLSAVLVEAKQVAVARSKTQREADCAWYLGDIALYRSDHAEARRRYEEAWTLYVQVSSVRGQANCIKGLGDIALVRSEHAEARRRYEEARTLYRRMGDVLGQANCVQRLGNIAQERSDHAEARRCYEEARPLFLQVGDVLGQANCVKGLGDIALERSEHAEARRCYEEARTLYRQVGSVRGQASCVKGLGDIALERSEYAEARRCYEEARPLSLQVGDVLGQANCVQGLGDIATAEGDLPAARERFQQSLLLYEQIAEPYSIGGAHQRLARLSEADEKRRHVQAARAAWASIDRPDLVAALDQDFGSD